MEHKKLESKGEYFIKFASDVHIITKLFLKNKVINQCLC